MVERPSDPCDALGKVGRADATLERCPKGGQRGAMSKDHQQRAEAPEGAVSSPPRLEAQGGVTSEGRQSRSWGHLLPGKWEVALGCSENSLEGTLKGLTPDNQQDRSGARVIYLVEMMSKRVPRWHS